MRTTHGGRSDYGPEAEFDSERAWAHLLDHPSNGMRRLRRSGPYGWKSLFEIARRYDQITQRAHDFSGPDVTETDVLAALMVNRALREKLDRDELDLINLARDKKTTWARIAGALGMRNRQSAERRRLQLSRAPHRQGGTPPRTQNDRVEAAREDRGRRAEREWALAHVNRIRAMADALTGIGDLQQRADRSREARIMSAPVSHGSTSLQMTWPGALRTCIAEHDHFRARPWDHVPRDQSDGPLEDWHIRQYEAHIAHRMLGLLAHAADPRYLDLSDHPRLAAAIQDLCQAFQGLRRS
ncbi:hypothetical protein ABT167_14625 [Streptomyces sp. NPDC001792]|uniref:hypothetical protein n=1 Tax=Streptomyces sp. NPDC001792 TaxID=3154524 RepID=UPI003331AF61